MTAVGAGLMVASMATTADAQMLVCSLGEGGGFQPAFNQPPIPYAQAEFNQVQRLLCPNGCGWSQFVANPGVGNAATFSFGGGRSLIAYQPAFMAQVFQGYGPSATFGVLAHEFGHHIDSLQAAAWMDHSWGRELRADAWAGCALARAGMPSDQLAQALMAIAAYPSRSHPGWNMRIPALRHGYMSCGGAAPSAFGGGAPSSPSRVRPGRPVASTDHCAVHTDCSTCVPVSGCGWCAGSGRCLSSPSACSSNWSWNECSSSGDSSSDDGNGDEAMRLRSRGVGSSRFVG